MTTERPRLPPPTRSMKASEDALLGASLAFGNRGKPVVKPKPRGAGIGGAGRGNGAVVGQGGNGALAAALSSAAGRMKALNAQDTSGSLRGGRAGRGGSEGVLSSQNTGSSVASETTGYTTTLRNQAQARGAKYRGGNGVGYLTPSAVDQIRSPSFIAATLAASRSASLSPNPTGGTPAQPLPRSPNVGPIPIDLRPSPRHGSRSPSVRSAESSRTSSEVVLDTRSIPPTGSLIGMFEKNEDAAGKKADRSKVIKKAKSSVVIKQNPSIPDDGSTTIKALDLLDRKATIPPPKPKSPNPKIVSGKGQIVPPSLDVSPSLPRRTALPVIQERQSSSTAPVSITPQPTLSHAPTLSQDDGASSSGDSFVSASDYQGPEKYERYNGEGQERKQEEYKPSWRAELAAQNRRMMSSSSSVTVGSLADAIVASSLASSRAGSPSKSTHGISSTSGLYPPLPPPSRRTKHHHHHVFHTGSKNDISRTPSPNKQLASNKQGGRPQGSLRTTMRTGEGREEVDEGEKRRGRKNLMKKHPNKHHEGDRKRWRDSITERERKRYEAVWASNRGLFTSVPSSTTISPELKDKSAENEVSNLVVRDIFSRSRLSPDVLEEVYALVDRRGNGTLGKEEFVVGLWLLDQRLKGRKLPIRVGESVWTSVGILSGIRVRSVK